MAAQNTKMTDFSSNHRTLSLKPPSGSRRTCILYVCDCWVIDVRGAITRKPWSSFQRVVPARGFCGKVGFAPQGRFPGPVFAESGWRRDYSASSLAALARGRGFARCNSSRHCTMRAIVHWPVSRHNCQFRANIAPPATRRSRGQGPVLAAPEGTEGTGLRGRPSPGPAGILASFAP